MSPPPPTVVPTPAQRELLERHLDEVAAWTSRINLTRIPRAEGWARHVVEALSLLDAAEIPPQGRLVDVGTGAGFPGIPIAIVRPDLTVSLVEADARRSAFLLHCRGLLGLQNLRIRTARAEEVGRDPAEREAHDRAVARALAAPAVAVELCLPLVAPGGALLLLVGDAQVAAGEATAAAAACGGGAPEPVGAGIVRVPKVTATPAAYPRRTGVPSRRPL